MPVAYCHLNHYRIERHTCGCVCVLDIDGASGKRDKCTKIPNSIVFNLRSWPQRLLFLNQRHIYIHNMGLQIKKTRRFLNKILENIRNSENSANCKKNFELYLLNWNGSSSSKMIETITLTTYPQSSLHGWQKK